MRNERDTSIDTIKALAIISVVYGHSVQFLGDSKIMSEQMWDSPLIMLIYMVHMPLFIFISGYFSNSLVDKNLKSVVRSKAKSLYIPMIAWGFVCVIATCILGASSYSFSLTGMARFISGTIRQYWFIRALFASIVMFKVSIELAKYIDRKKFFKRSVRNLILILSLFVLYLIPENIPVLMILLTKYMYIFFLFGYFFKKYNCIEKFEGVKGMVLIFIAMALYLLLFTYWKVDYFIYFSSMDVWRNAPYEIFLPFAFRTLGGVLGIIIIFYSAKNILKLQQSKLLVTIGSMTLGIYLIQGVVFSVLERLNFIIENKSVYTVLCLLVTVLIISVSLMIIEFIKKFRYASFLLLGIDKKAC